MTSGSQQPLCVSVTFNAVYSNTKYWNHVVLLSLRTWQADPSSGPVYLSSVSTQHPDVLPEGVRAHVHACLYLLEPSGAGKTRLTHVCRTDAR